MSFSFWEKSYLQNTQGIAVVGAGIVGLTTAIFLKKLDPKLPVTVIDRQWPPHGASTKNAGFMCFGSPTEVTDDIDLFGESLAMATFARRFEGRKALLELISEREMDFKKYGGIELFKDTDIQSIDLTYLNKIVESSVGIKHYFKPKENNHFASFFSQYILAEEEGSVNPVWLIHSLKKKADGMGIRFIFKEVSQVQAGELISFKDGSELNFDKTCICLNAFATDLVPELEDLKPARNNVIVTSSLPGFVLPHVVHIDKGYLYMRKIGDHLLLGGARNRFGEGEYTNQLEVNDSIVEYLKNYLIEEIGIQSPFDIVSSWAGILGVGSTKSPIVRKIKPNLYVGVRMGGMGVAMGAGVGKELASLILLG